jgi:hypothetical protein
LFIALCRRLWAAREKTFVKNSLGEDSADVVIISRRPDVIRGVRYTTLESRASRRKTAAQDLESSRISDHVAKEG